MAVLEQRQQELVDVTTEVCALIAAAQSLILQTSVAQGLDTVATVEVRILFCVSARLFTAA